MCARCGHVLEHAEERGAKVVLIGDPDQLKAIGPGDAFRGLIEQTRRRTRRHHPPAGQRSGNAKPPSISPTVAWTSR